MKSKKRVQFTMAIPIILTCSLCSGTTSVGAATTSQTNKLKQQIASIALPSIDSNLTLVTKEYSMADIKALNISGIVAEALSENVSITRGGKTLKVQYYVQNQNDYTLQNEMNSDGTFEELVLRRVTSTAPKDTKLYISITIPNDIDFKVIRAKTVNGNIILENCIGKNVISKTQSGDIIINGGLSSSILEVETDTGNAFISDFSANKYGTNFSTNSGTITFQPKDNVQNYYFATDKGKDAQIMVNGQNYNIGDDNTNAKKEIGFNSTNGFLIVQDKESEYGSGAGSSSGFKDKYPSYPGDGYGSGAGSSSGSEDKYPQAPGDGYGSGAGSSGSSSGSEDKYPQAPGDGYGSGAGSSSGSEDKYPQAPGDGYGSGAGSS